MDKKGQSLGLSIIGIICFVIIGFVSINFLFNEVDTARGLLSCSSPSTISDASKLLCLVVDITIPYWIYIVLAVAIGIVLVRLLL